jgi:hypothetical protein
MWTAGGVFLHAVGSTATVEITGPAGALADTRGMASSLDVTSPTLGSTWIWTAAGVFLHGVGTTTAAAITAGGLPLADPRGIVVSLDGTSPTATSVWFWTATGVFLHVVGTTTAASITAAGAPIAGCWGAVTSPDSTSPTGSALWFRTPSRVLLHVTGTTTAAEITAPGGGAILSPALGPGASALAVTKNTRFPGAGFDRTTSPFPVATAGAGVVSTVRTPTDAPPEPGLASMVANDGISIVGGGGPTDLIDLAVAVLRVSPPLLVDGFESGDLSSWLPTEP